MAIHRIITLYLTVTGADRNSKVPILYIFNIHVLKMHVFFSLVLRSVADERCFHMASIFSMEKGCAAMHRALAGRRNAVGSALENRMSPLKTEIFSRMEMSNRNHKALSDSLQPYDKNRGRFQCWVVLIH